MDKTNPSRFFKQAPDEGGELSELKQQVNQLERELDEKHIMDELNNIEKDYALNSGSSFSDDMTVVGETVDMASLQKLYASEPWLYVVISVISKTIASLPVKMEKRKITKEVLDETTGEFVYREVWVDASAEPECSVLTYPNESQPSIEFFQLLLIDLLATGNCYIYVDNGDEAVSVDRPVSRLEEVLRNCRKCRTKGMYRLNSALMEPLFDDKTLDHEGYGMQTMDGYVRFEKREVIHIRMPNPLNPIIGLSPMSAVLKNVMIDRFTAEHMIRFYKQGARLGGVITTEKKITKDQISRLTRSFDSNFTGKKNHHKTLILPQGMKYEIIEQNPGETSLIEFAKYNKEPILSAYSVPPVKAGLLDGATYANALIQEKEFWTGCILPLKSLFEAGFNLSNSFLRTQRNLRMTFSTAHIEVLKEDLKAKAEMAELMSRAGMSINEIRKQIWSLPKVEDGDLIPLVERAKLEGSRAMGTTTLSAPHGSTKTDPDQNQPDLAYMTDIEPTRVTYEQRIQELVRVSLGSGVPLDQAISRAIEQATQEGFAPSSGSGGAPKPTESAQDEAANGPSEEPKATNEEEVEGKSEAHDEKYNQLQTYCKTLTGEDVLEIMGNKWTDTVQLFQNMREGVEKDLEKIDFSDDKVRQLFTKSNTKISDEDEAGVLELMEWVKEFVESNNGEFTASDRHAVEHGFKRTLRGVSATFPNDEAQAVIEERGAEQIRGIFDSTKEHIKNVIAREYRDQASSDQIKASIFEYFNGIPETRAITIARTETLTAVSEGQKLKIDKAQEETPELRGRIKKRWITAQDDRVRSDNRSNHRALDGEVQDEDKAFSNGLKYPRQIGSPGYESINCRCAAHYFVDDDEEVINDILPTDMDASDAIQAFANLLGF